MYCGKQLEEGTQCGCLGMSGQVGNPMTGNQIANGEWNMNQMNGSGFARRSGQSWGAIFS